MNNFEDLDECQICYETECLENFVQFTECRHIFCRVCALELLFQPNIQCPLDRISIKTIRTERSLELTVSDFKNKVMKDEPEIFVNDIEFSWSQSIIDMYKHYCIIIETMRELIMTFEEKIMCKTMETKLFRSSISKCFDKTRPILKNRLFFNTSEKQKFVTKYIESFHRNDLDPTFYNILRSTRILHFFQLRKPHFLKLSAANLSSTTFMRDVIKTLKEDLSEMCSSLFFINSFAISFVSDNKEIYSHLRPEMQPDGVDICLICSKKVRDHFYAQFQNCSHKICLTCIKRFMVIHGSCPFHKSEIRDLMIFSTDVTDHNVGSVKVYLLENIVKIAMELFDEIDKLNLKIINPLLSNNNDISFLMNELTELCTVVNSGAYDVVLFELSARKITKGLAKIFGKNVIHFFEYHKQTFHGIINLLKVFIENIPPTHKAAAKARKIPVILFRFLFNKNGEYESFHDGLYNLYNKLMSGEDLYHLMFRDHISELLLNYKKISICGNYEETSTEMISTETYLKIKQKYRLKLVKIQEELDQ